MEKKFDDIGLALVDKFLCTNELEDLIERLKKFPKTKLVLKGNCLGAEGAKVIGDYISSEVCELVELILEWNQFGNAGCTIIAHALQHNTSLQVLDLRNNNIRSEGAIILAQALESNKSLRELDLRWNQIDDKGALAFKNALVSRKPPLKLQLGGNHLSQSSELHLNSWIGGDTYDESLGIGVENISPSNATTNSLAKNLNSTNHDHNQLNYTRTSGLQDANNQRLQKETIALRQQCKTLQEEATCFNKQLELSAVRITELEHTVLQVQFTASQTEEQLRSAHARISVQADERERLMQQFEKERQLTANIHKDAIIKRDLELSKISNERDHAVAEQRAAQDYADHYQAQMEAQNAKSVQHLTSLREETDTLRAKLSESTLSEANLKSEIALLQQRLLRSEAMCKQLEEEGRKEKENAAIEYHARMKERDDLEVKMKADYHAELEAANSRIIVQSKETQALQHKIATLEASVFTSKADMELQNEKAIAQVRDDEAKRTELILSELKAKIEILTNSRAELEKRCSGYLEELTSSQSNQKEINVRITKQVNNADTELARLREVNSKLREDYHLCKSEVTSNTVELTELRQKVGALEELNADMKSKLSSAISSEQAMVTKVRELELLQAKYNSSRQQEFYMIVESVTASVKKEFASLQTALQVKDKADDTEDDEEESSSEESGSGEEEEPAYTVEEESSVDA